MDGGINGFQGILGRFISRFIAIKATMAAHEVRIEGCDDGGNCGNVVPNGDVDPFIVAEWAGVQGTQTGL